MLAAHSWVAFQMLHLGSCFKSTVPIAPCMHSSAESADSIEPTWPAVPAHSTVQAVKMLHCTALLLLSTAPICWLMCRQGAQQAGLPCMSTDGELPPLCSSELHRHAPVQPYTCGPTNVAAAEAASSWPSTKHCHELTAGLCAAEAAATAPKCSGSACQHSRPACCYSGHEQRLVCSAQTCCVCWCQPCG